MKPRYRQLFRVRRYETEPTGRLQPEILCKLLQEAATAHAAELGVAVETLKESGVAWVLAHLGLEIERWPGPDEEIVVETWPEAANRLFTERRFEVFGGTGEMLAAAATLWLVLDLERRRPVRLPPVVREALTRLDIGTTPMKPDSLEGPDPADREGVFTVGRSDLDLADHVNNTSYIRWAMEAVPDEVWKNQELVELQIGFLSECHQGQTIVSISQTIGDARGAEVRHEIARRKDGEPAARAKTVWRSPD